MATLIFKNTGGTALSVNDLGIYLEASEELDLIVNCRDEDIIESDDIESALSGDGEVWLNDTTELTYQQLIDYLTKLTKYDVIDYAYITAEDATTDITAAELEALTDGSEVSGHIHDGRYFTETELNNGELDSRYYTETELSTSGQSAVHWDNITNAPQFGDLHWQDPVDRAHSGYGSGTTLPTTGNTLNDARMVKDDGDGKPAQYVCVATTGTWDQQWKKIADVDWGTAAYIGVTPTGNLAADDVQEALEELQSDIDNIVNGTLDIDHDLDDAYNDGSTVAVDTTDVIWDLTDGRDFNIRSDSGSTEILSVSAAASVDTVTIDGKLVVSGSSIELEGNVASHFRTVGANLTFETTTSGNISISSIGNLSLKDQYLSSSINLSESGNTALDVGFTATSIIGAINELYGASGGIDTLDDAYDATAGSGAGRAITVDSGAVKLDATSGTDAPLELTELSSAPTTNLASGQLMVIDGELYCYDGTRTKWLSVDGHEFHWNDFCAKGKFMRIGSVSSVTTGFKVPVNATIVKIAVKIGGGNLTRQLKLGKNGAAPALKTITPTAGSYTSTNDNIDVNAGDYIQMYVTGSAGLPAKNIIATVYLRWRK